jgi:hypothetical protein
VATNHAAGEPAVTEVIDAAGCPVTLAGRVDEGEIARGLVTQKSPLDGFGDRFGVSSPQKTRARDS